MSIGYPLLNVRDGLASAGGAIHAYCAAQPSAFFQDSALALILKRSISRPIEDDCVVFPDTLFPPLLAATTVSSIQEPGRAGRQCAGDVRALI
jgi:hypothetical protein